MILELILDPIFYLGKFIINLIPEIAFNVPGAILGLVELMALSSFLVPWLTIVNCIIIAVAFYNVNTMMSIINFIIRKIPGLS